MNKPKSTQQELRPQPSSLLASEQQIDELGAPRAQFDKKLSEVFEAELYARGVAINAELSLEPELWHLAGIPGPNVDEIACLALLKCLEGAFNHPHIAASPTMYGFVQDIYAHIGSLDAYHIGKPEKLEKAFAKVARGKSAAISAKAPRNKDGYASALGLCKKWFSKPETYNSKAAFYRDLIEKEWCSTEQTARKWLSKIVMEIKPSDAWNSQFEKRGKKVV